MCTFRASTFVVGTSYDLGQPFRLRHKSWVWVGGRIGYLITIFALLPSITEIARLKKIGLLDLQCFS